jgi:hypothetical protein
VDDTQMAWDGKVHSRADNVLPGAVLHGVPATVITFYSLGQRITPRRIESNLDQTQTQTQLHSTRLTLQRSPLTPPVAEGTSRRGLALRREQLHSKRPPNGRRSRSRSRSRCTGRRSRSDSDCRARNRWVLFTSRTSLGVMPPTDEDAAFVRVRDFVLSAIVWSGRHE